MQKLLLILPFIFLHCIVQAYDSNLSLGQSQGEIPVENVFKEKEHLVNPYLSIGLGTDRLFVLPSFGIKIGKFNLSALGYPSEASYYKQRTLSMYAGMDLVKLPNRGKFRKYITFGASLIYDLYDGEHLWNEQIYGGPLFGYSFYKIDGVLSFHVRYGIGLYYDQGVFRGSQESSEFEEIIYLPNFGLSLQLHVFEFVK